MVILTVGSSLLISLALVPFIRKFSFRSGQLSIPREDRWHRNPTPSLGGAAMFGGFAIALLLVRLIRPASLDVRWGLLAGSAIMFLLGLYDDFKHITPPAKLVGQILAAVVAIFFGYTTNFFGPRMENQLLAQALNVLLTVFWLVGITNAINLLDNMDGLAAGLALITSGFLAFFFWKVGNETLLLISLALAGGILGFLAFNFPPASIFMGDSGSLFLGFTLAVLAIARQPQASNVFAVMGVPTLLFLLPILDTTLVTFTRLLRGQSPTQGGRDHTSHRLIAFGLTERSAVLVLYSVALVSGVMAATLESLSYWYSLVIVPILVLSLSLLTAYLGGLKVVDAPSTPSRGRAVTRFMLELTYRRRLLEIVLDFFLIAFAYYLAFLTRFGFSMNPTNLEAYLRTVPIAWVGAYLAFYTFGVYRGVWRYTGIDELLRYLKAALGTVVLVTAAVLLLHPSIEHSPVVFVLFFVYLFLLLAASRSSFKMLDQFSGRQVKGVGERVLICGGGDTGEMALRWILMNNQLGYNPVGILDDNPFLTGRQIHGVEILGEFDQLERVIKERNIAGVILAVENNDNCDRFDTIATACRKAGIWLRNLRLEFELVEDNHHEPSYEPKN